MDSTLFGYLFEGAKSSKQERVEDFVTELIGFMFEIDSSFKKCFIEFLNKRLIQNIDEETVEFLTQETVVKQNFDTPFRYDMVLEAEDGKRKIIIENKIESKDNQFLKYINNKSEDEEFLLLIPKNYPYVSGIEKNHIIYWEDLILFLKEFVKIEEEENETLKQIRKSFFNFLFDYAGLYYNTPRKISDNFIRLLQKYIKNKNQKNTFLSYKSLFPLGFHTNAPYFGIEITDFFDKSVDLILEDNITKLKEDKKDHKEEIKILNSNKYKEIVNLFEKEENDNSFFNIGLEMKDNLNEIKKSLNEFILDFYDNNFAGKIMDELNKFIKLIEELIRISGSEEQFKEDIIQYYVSLKEIERV